MEISLKNNISIKKWNELFRSRFGEYYNLNDLSEIEMESLIDEIHSLSDEDIFELMPVEPTSDCVEMSVSWGDSEND